MLFLNDSPTKRIGWRLQIRVRILFFLMCIICHIWGCWLSWVLLKCVGGVFYEFRDGSKRVGDVDSEAVHGLPWHNLFEKRISWQRSWHYGSHRPGQLEIQRHSGTHIHTHYSKMRNFYLFTNCQKKKKKKVTFFESLHYKIWNHIT